MLTLVKTDDYNCESGGRKTYSTRSRHGKHPALHPSLTLMLIAANQRCNNELILISVLTYWFKFSLIPVFFLATSAERIHFSVYHWNVSCTLSIYFPANLLFLLLTFWTKYLSFPLLTSSEQASYFRFKTFEGNYYFPSLHAFKYQTNLNLKGGKSSIKEKHIHISITSA